MLASLAMMGMENIHAMNALKTVLATCINGMAVHCLYCSRRRDPSKALFMISGAIRGDMAELITRKKSIPSGCAAVISLTGSLLTIYFFRKYY